MRSIVMTALCLLPLLSFSQAPNFVLILADDMGWTGTSVQISPTESASASDYYYTPNLETLASQGMTFSQGYAPAAKCSPTRCSILTGETPAKNGHTQTGNQIAVGEILIEGNNTSGLPTDDQIIPEWLKATGLNYRTAHFGKWHLSNPGPSDRGFDESDGATANNQGNNEGGDIQDDPKKIFELTDKGIAFMQESVNLGQPFYLQLSHYAVHGGIETTQESYDYFNPLPPGAYHDDPVYGGMTKDFDTGVGSIMQEIIDLGIAGNTYIIFLSDNGSSTGMSPSTPLQGGKNQIYEGGVRVPFIVAGPSIAPGSYNATPVVGYDLFPTIAELSGGTNALPTDLDGESIVPFLTQNSTIRNQPVYFHSPHYVNGNIKPNSAAVDGNFKYMIDYETGDDFLFDLDSDIGEANNIAGSNPTILKDLKIQLRDHLKAVGAVMPTLNPDHGNYNGTGDDVDEDGLDDEWEFTELLTAKYSAHDDPDFDGIDNLAEYLAGSDPLVGGVGGGTVTINEGGFESGWEIWNDSEGGPDCRRNNNDSAYANSGSFCIRLRDDDPTASFMTTDVLDLSAYESITVDFSFIAVSFEDAEDFWLQLSTDGGATFTTVEDWVFPDDFSNDQRYDPTVTIQGPFNSNCALRFRCDANRNNDLVYLDDIVITGTLSSSNLVSNDDFEIKEDNLENPLGNVSINNTLGEEDESSIEELRLFPNPTSGDLNIDFTLIQESPVQMEVVDFSGKVLLQRQWNAGFGKHRVTEEVSQLPEGHYFLRLVTNDGKWVDRFVVLH